VVTERNPAIVECYREVALHFQNKDRIRLRAMVLIRTKFLSAILKMIQREGCHPVPSRKAGSDGSSFKL
jgi:hypothetical protein